MTKTDNGEYTSIIWNDKKYIPFCVVSKSDCNKKIICIDSDKNEIVSLYKDLPQCVLYRKGLEMI